MACSIMEIVTQIAQFLIFDIRVNNVFVINCSIYIDCIQCIFSVDTFKQILLLSVSDDVCLFDRLTN